MGELGWRGRGAAAPVKAAFPPWEPVTRKPNALDNVEDFIASFICPSITEFFLRLAALSLKRHGGCFEVDLPSLSSAVLL